MGLYNPLARHVFAPALDIARGTRTMRSLSELEESQWWSAERLQQLQSDRLRRLVAHAYSHVPYYRQLMHERGLSPGDIGSASDLCKLPVLTKEIIRANTELLLAEGFPHHELIAGTTGGSTGTPLRFFSSRESRYTRGLARSLRAIEWAGVYLGDSKVRVTKKRMDGSVLGQVSERIHDVFTRETFIDSLSFSHRTLPAIVKRIRKLKPRCLIGYASAICIIAEYILESGSAVPEVGTVVVGGEQLFEPQRELLATVFDVQPFSKYSSFENFDIAMECEAHMGMHVAAEDLIVEIVDADGEPVSPGSPGRLLVTNLHEYGLPLIRYDTDDESSFIEGPCPCGRELPLISNVIGKTGDVIYTPSGKRLSPLTLGSSNLAPLGIKRFQFIQEKVDHVVVRIVPGTELSTTGAEELSANVERHFSRVLGDDVWVEILVVDRIEPTPAGKHLFLISKVRSRGDRAANPRQV